MQRHRHDDVAAREMDGSVGAVGVFEFQHQRFAVAVVSKYGAGASVGRLILEAGSTDEIVDHRALEG